MIDRQQFAACLFGWTQAIHEATGGELIAIDGKALRRSFAKKSGKAMLHLVTAWSSENGYENHATVHGGAIYNHANLTVNASSRFYWNTAENSGGAIYNAFFGTAVIGDRTELWENSTRLGSGGAIFNSGVLQLDTTDLARNVASTDSGGTGYGGAIYNEGQLSLSNVQAEDNTADAGNHFYQKNVVGATTTAANVSSQSGGQLRLASLLASHRAVGCRLTDLDSASTSDSVAQSPAVMEMSWSLPCR